MKGDSSSNRKPINAQSVNSAIYALSTSESQSGNVTPFPTRSSKSYAELFAIGIDGWCYGIEHYPGEIYPELVLIILREMAVDITNAIKNGVVFDVIEIGKKFSKAAKYLINEQDISFEILANLPHPRTLDEDGQFTLAQIIDHAEQTFGGILEPLQQRWATQRLAA